MNRLFAVPLALIPFLAAAHDAAPGNGYRFDFGPGAPAPGYTQVTAATDYTEARGYGFEFGIPVTCVDRNPKDTLDGDLCFGSRPFYFSARVPEGDYDVTITFGDGGAAAATALKAESRRLFMETARTAAGQFGKRTFTVNRRSGSVDASESIALSATEKAYFDWDGKLTFEFTGDRPSVTAMEIIPATRPIRVFLAGNSTVCDWENETETAWGQMIPRFFKPGVSVINLAKSGLTAGTFIAQNRLDKIAGLIGPGDYLFAEFAHNDMKDTSAGALETYQANLKKLLDTAKARGAVAVLVSPTARRSFDAQGKAVNTFVAAAGDYLATMKKVAKAEKAPLIDLNAMSTRFIEALGPTESAQAYFTNDNTHWNDYGAFELARCVAEGIRADSLGLAAWLAQDAGTFDPAHPDPVGTWTLPLSPDTSLRGPSFIPKMREVGKWDLQSREGSSPGRGFWAGFFFTLTGRRSASR